MAAGRCGSTKKAGRLHSGLEAPSLDVNYTNQTMEPENIVEECDHEWVPVTVSHKPHPEVSSRIYYACTKCPAYRWEKGKLID